MDPREQAFTCLIRLHELRWLQQIFAAVGDWQQAEDLLQEVYRSAWADPGFDPDRPDADGYLRQRIDWRIKDWYRRRHHAREVQLASQSRRADEPATGVAEVQDNGREPVSHLITQEDTQLFWAIFSTLPASDQLLILLRLEGMPYEEISALVGLPRTTINNRLYQARQQLKRWLPPDLFQE